jgi:hypothetical protein
MRASAVQVQSALRRVSANESRQVLNSSRTRNLIDGGFRASADTR